MGKTLTYTTDISSVGCSCNAALFFSSMPGYNSQGQPDPGTSGDYTCNANMGNGVWCWEMDVMEANTYAIQTTPHQCDAPAGTYIPSCDRAGCGTNAYYTFRKQIKK